MQGLTVLYDAHCGLCREARGWLERQPQWVPLEFVAAGSGEARARFLGLDHAETLARLTVIGDGGQVFQGEGAWLTCLWALRGYREAALSFAEPPLLPAFRLGVWLVTKLRRSEACDGTCAA